MAKSQDPLDPRRDADMPAFLGAVAGHPDTKEVYIRFDGLEAELKARGITDVGGVTQWSQMRHGSLDHLDERRRHLHGEIADAIFKGIVRPEGPPRAVFVIGPPGAGKTTHGVPLVEAAFGRNFAPVNADDIKEKLPEYEGWNAAALHEESTYVAEHLVRQRAVARRHNVLLDMTGKNGGKVEEEMRVLRQAGYKIFLMLVHVPPWLSAKRVWDRFQANPFGRAGADVAPGRFVPPEYAYESVSDHPLATFKRIAGSDRCDGACRVNAKAPAGPSGPKIVYSIEWPSS